MGQLGGPSRPRRVPGGWRSAPREWCRSARLRRRELVGDALLVLVERVCDPFGTQHDLFRLTGRQTEDGANHANARDKVEAVAFRLREHLFGRIVGRAHRNVFAEVVGPNWFHFQLSSESGMLHEGLRRVLALSNPPHGVEFQVDIDPYSML